MTEGSSADTKANGEWTLFVYGTLTDPFVYKVITGREPQGEPAVLKGYRKVTSRKSFPHIKEAPGAEVQGILLRGITAEALALLDRYEGEGELFVRRPVIVETAAGPEATYTYVAGPKLIWDAVGEEVEVEERLAQFIKERIEATIAAGVSAVGKFRDLEVRARREIWGDAVEELVRDHFDHPGLPQYLIKRRLEEPGLPSLRWLADDEEARRYAQSYLWLIVKAVIFNQLEDRVNHDFRGAVRVTDQYYDHAISSLAALRFLADNLGVIQDIARSLGIADYDPSLEYVDYVVGALFIADELYRREALAPYIEDIKSRRSPGSLPLGCECEFSPLGPAVIGAAPGADGKFDGFFYFDDFKLGDRLWKLGGHVDNHRIVVPGRGRVRGFLEFALGRYKILGDVSKPVTGDPVLLSELANAVVVFAEVPPHSLHISIQLEEGRPLGPPPRPEQLICLLILGGDLNADDTGVLRERRIWRGELQDPFGNLNFSRFNAHRRHPEDEAPAQVAEYLFPRLFFEHSYVDLIVALKAFQLATNAPPLEQREGAPHAAYNREVAALLTAWAERPTAVSRSVIQEFVGLLEEGLVYERLNLGGHDELFCNKWLAKIERKLSAYNAYLEGDRDAWTREL